MINRIKLIIFGTIISVMTWIFIYMIIYTVESRIGLGNGGGQTTRRLPMVAPAIAQGVLAVQFEELNDPYLKSIARTAILQFNKNEVDEGFKVTNMCMSSSDRDDVLLAVVEGLLRLTSGGLVPLVPAGSKVQSLVQPPLNANAEQRLEYEKKVEERRIKSEEIKTRRAEESRKKLNQKIANIEAVAGKISDPLKRATALSEIAVHWVSPIHRESLGEMEAVATKNAATKNAAAGEMEAVAAKNAAAALEALGIEQHKRMAKKTSYVIPDSLLWVGIIVSAIIGFFLMAFAIPVIEAFVKVIIDEILNDLDKRNIYQRVKYAVQHAAESEGSQK